jgi:Nitrogenase molybdenum-iron protein, alpha and beta chains
MSIDANAVVLERYNAKVFKNRKEHMLKVNPAEDQIIIANTRAIPGIMTNRGCCYAGCKGVVLGPIKDMVTITHGPVGCGFYSWGTRRNKAKAEGDYPQLHPVLLYHGHAGTGHRLWRHQEAQEGH